MTRPPHLRVILPSGWVDHPPGVVVLSDLLHLHYHATLAFEHSTARRSELVLLFSGGWPTDIEERLAPFLERAFHALSLDNNG